MRNGYEYEGGRFHLDDKERWYSYHCIGRTVGSRAGSETNYWRWNPNIDGDWTSTGRESGMNGNVRSLRVRG